MCCFSGFPSIFILFLYFIQNQGETITHLMHSKHQDHLTQTIKVKKKLPITKSAASNIFSTNPSGIFTGNSTQANTRLSNSFLDKLFIFTMFFFFLHIHKTQGSQWYFLTPVTNSKAKTLTLIPSYSNSTKKQTKSQHPAWVILDQVTLSFEVL